MPAPQERRLQAAREGRTGVPTGVASVAFVVIGVAWVLLARVEGLERGEPFVGPVAVIAFAACALLIWRTKAPTLVALITLIIVAFAPGAAGAAVIALFSLSAHRRPSKALPFGAAFVAVSSWNSFRAVNGTVTDAVGQVGVALLLSALAIVGGSMLRNRRRLIQSLIELAANAESMERERVERVRLHERTMLAREMHDVLAHRMSLVAIHAGALEYAEELPAEDTRRAAGIVRAGVHQMLEELRGLIYALRDDALEEGALGRTPTLLDVAVLFRESEEAGRAVDADIHIHDVISAIPGQIDRVAYRVIQEGLTNARKHGGKGAVRVVVDGSAAAGLTVRISQPLQQNSTNTAPSLPGSRSGLVGLVERAALVGGSVHFGPLGHDFVLGAHFPLSTRG
jgi:signal transduction histidine kinase